MSTQKLKTLEALLSKSLGHQKIELNELDWKNGLSPKTIKLAQHVSAFANFPGGGFLVYGVDDQTGSLRDVLGPEAKEILDRISNIASTSVEPRVQVEGFFANFNGATLFVVSIAESEEKPVHLRGKSLEESFIRTGGTSRRMDKSDLRQAFIRSRQLRWEELPNPSFQRNTNLGQLLDFEQVIKRLNIGSFSSDDTSNTWLIHHRLLRLESDALLPTNLGMITCCKDFRLSPGFERCCVRILMVAGVDKLSPAKERVFSNGYVNSLDAIEQFIVDSIPHSEVYRQATRIDEPVIPRIAIRELVGNAVIHRDYSQMQSQIVVEIYTNRIEISSPGGLLPGITMDRLVDHPPRTRNELLADFMKQLNFYEERGSGYDKIVAALELFGLPPVEVRTGSDFFTAILLFPKDFSQMGKEERIEAAYQHACLNFVVGRKTTNTSLRERFKLPNTSSKVTQIFRLLTEATNAGRIKVRDEKTGPKMTEYVPYWA